MCFIRCVCFILFVSEPVESFLPEFESPSDVSWLLLLSLSLSFDWSWLLLSDGLVFVLSCFCLDRLLNHLSDLDPSDRHLFENHQFVYHPESSHHLVFHHPFVAGLFIFIVFSFWHLIRCGSCTFAIITDGCYFEFVYRSWLHTRNNCLFCRAVLNFRVAAAVNRLLNSKGRISVVIPA